MTASRNSAIAALFSGFFFCWAATQPVGAQESATDPIPLAPQPDPAEAIVEDEPSAPASGPAVPEGFEVEELGALGAEGIGVLTVDQGGFGVAAWRGTNRALLEAALPLLPAPSSSPMMRALARRLLLTEAEPPSGVADGPSLLALRVDRLAALGNREDLEALLSRIPPESLDAGMAARVVELRWLAGDPDRGCREIEPLLARFDGDLSLQKAAIYCHARAGRKAPAMLGLDLLHEQGHDDPSFARKIDAVLAGKTQEIEVDGALQPLDLAILATSGIKVSADNLAEAAPLVIAAVARRTQLVDPALRLAAAEKAALLGALPAETLMEIYAAEVATPAELDAGEDADAASAHGRAILYQAAALAHDPNRRARLLGRFLAASRADGTYARAAAVAAPLLLQVVPGDGLAWFAAEAARALLFIGRYESVTAWLAVGQASKDAKDVAALPALWLFARLFGEGLPAVLAADQAEGASARATRLLAVLDALEAPGADAWSLLAAGEEGIGLEVGDARLWFALGGAAAENRVGEAVLLGLAALGDGGPAGAPPLMLGRALASLRAVGLEAEARALAFEALLAGGE